MICPPRVINLPRKLSDDNLGDAAELYDNSSGSARSAVEHSGCKGEARVGREEERTHFGIGCQQTPTERDRRQDS